MKIIFKSILVFNILLLILTSLVAGNPARQSQVIRAHPLLVQIAREDPDQVVSVIIQKSATSQNLEKWVVQQGGEVTHNLPIINAFAAKMQARAALDLARQEDVHWVSLDTPMVKSGCNDCIETSNLKNAYISAIGADKVWNEAPYIQGQGVTVAIVDSGIDSNDDLEKINGGKRILASQYFNTKSKNPHDNYGHGTHIAGIIGGNGSLSYGYYIGVAPKVNLVNVKVTNDLGMGSTSDVVQGLQWIFDNKSIYNIRVVNLSLNSSLPETYDNSPLDAALEILWFNGIVVVVSAGNNGIGGDNGIDFPPANDPFVITVGAVDDKNTPNLDDDSIASFSANGVTKSGFVKPEIVAPGKNIISMQPTKKSILYFSYPENRIDGPMNGPDHYFQMSGTSMASAVVAGAVALLLQDEPYLNPDQVKYRLINTARPIGEPGNRYLDIFAAVHGDTYQTSNTGLPASQLLWTGSDPVNWGSVNWGSVNWGSVNWGSVNWGSVNWGSVNWGSDYWNK